MKATRIIKDEPEDYNNPDAPWWEELANWCERGVINAGRIKPFTHATDRRTAQLCNLLERMATKPKDTIQENDSLTRWMLQKKNANLMEQKFRKAPGHMALS